jgi:glycosyltransferase involved in cell wall biosynthesis
MEIMRSQPELSVVIPVYNEAESLPTLAAELDEALRTLGRSAEVIFVDDGSADETPAVLRQIARADPRVRVLRLARNAGQSAAFHAGFAASRGRYIATLDADLQNDPRDLAVLWGYLNRCDAAVGWRHRRHDGWLKRLSSRVANFVRRVTTGHAVHDSACSLRMMRRECAAAIPPFDGMHRFVPTLVQLAGYRVLEVPVSHRPRRFGTSKYGVRNRALRALADLLAVRWMMSRHLEPYVAEADDVTVSDEREATPSLTSSGASRHTRARR